MAYYQNYSGMNEHDNDVYPQTFYHNNSLVHHNRKQKPRKSKRESMAVDPNQYYGSPVNEPAGSYDSGHYFDRRSSYMFDQSYYQNQPVYNSNRKQRKSKKYRHEPITPDGEYLPFEQDGEYGNLAYDNDSQVVSDDTWTTNEMEEEEEDPFVDDTTRKNTVLNSEPHLYDPDEVFEAIVKQPTPVQQFQDVTPILSPQEEALPEPVKKKWYKGLMNKGFMLKMKKSKKTKAMQQDPHPSTPAVHVISVNNNEMLGDVLNSNQQKEIINQLYQQPSNNSANMVLPPEQQKITSLDRIWVFRLWTEEATNENVAWIGFDFENQLKIEKHVQELESQPEDGRLAIYDSHIRHKQMPVIVTPNEKKGYYFTDMNQNQLVTLEVTFIQNNHQKVTFVYRV